MESSTQVILSGILTFGVPLVFACRELIMIRRPPRGSWGGDGPPPPAPVPPPPDFTPQGMMPQKPLPECLIPKPFGTMPRTDAPQRTRVLEPV